MAEAGEIQPCSLRQCSGDGVVISAGSPQICGCPAGEATRLVYTASKSKHGPMWREFRTAWSDLGVRVVATWIDESGEGETADFSDLWTRCVAEASAADVLVCFHQSDEEWKGAYIEIGAALASGKPVYVIGRPPGSWVHHPLVTFASDPDDALMDFLARSSVSGSSKAPE